MLLSFAPLFPGWVSLGRLLNALGPFSLLQEMPIRLPVPLLPDKTFSHPETTLM